VGQPKGRKPRPAPLRHVAKSSDAVLFITFHRRLRIAGRH
jgi:hypothetical protein